MARHILLCTALALAAAVSAGCRGRQTLDNRLVGFHQESWTKLGERRVRLANDIDVIPVTILKGRYKRVMIVVHDSSLEMFDITVRFANGDTFSPSTRLHFAEDSRSRVIDLPGTRRTIRSVEFRYRSENALTGVAQAELWGRE